jgi:hypothetical protein
VELQDLNGLSFALAVLKAALDVDIGRRIKAESPALGQALLGYIVGVMSERLSFASLVIGVLQR